MDTKPYLEYLDKEMTIMGILSAASVATPAGILNAIATKDNAVASAFWNVGESFIITASVYCLLAASCFYKQRSQLAWLYGQICLAEALHDKNSALAKVRDWLEEADSWGSWWPYSWGFTFLVAGFVDYLLVLFFFIALPRWPLLPAHAHTIKVYCWFACALGAVATASLQYYVLTRYKFSDDYWGEFRADVLRLISWRRK
jgi:hypothetical protein